MSFKYLQHSRQTLMFSIYAHHFSATITLFLLMSAKTTQEDLLSILVLQETAYSINFWLLSMNWIT